MNCAMPFAVADSTGAQFDELLPT